MFLLKDATTHYLQRKSWRGRALRPFLAKRCAFSTNYTKTLFSVSNRFLSSNCSWIAVFPFCLFYHHPGDFPKLRSACWGHIPLTGGMRCVSMARLVYHEGWAPPTTISTSFPLLLHKLRDSETSVQIWLSLIINHIPGAWTSLCSAFKIGNYLALFISFQLGSALLTVMTNPLVRAGISSQFSPPGKSHHSNLCNKNARGQSVTLWRSKPIHWTERPLWTIRIFPPNKGNLVRTW